MASAAENPPRRIALCLVVDEQTACCFPTAMRYLQIGLIDEPIDVILVAPDDPRSQAIWTAPTTLVSYRAGQWPFQRWARRRAVESVQKKLDTLSHDSPVVVHCLSPSVAPLAAEIAAAVDGELMASITSAGDLLQPELQAAFHSAVAFIVPAPQIKRAIGQSPFSQKRVEVVPVGLPAGSAPAAFNNQLRAPSLIVASELTPESGIDTLLHAVKRVLPFHPNLPVFIIGKGPAEQNLRHLADVLEVSPHVTFTGRLEHWRTALEAADVFCLPGRPRIFREEPLHALAAGLAIIAADGTFYEELIHQETALLFPLGDDVELAEQLRQLLDHPERARTFAATAQAQARKGHSASRMIGEHVRVYQEVATRRETLRLPVGR